MHCFAFSRDFSHQDHKDVLFVLGQRRQHGPASVQAHFEDRVIGLAPFFCQLHHDNPAVGLVSFPNLPVAPLPQIDFPTIQVSASLPGALVPL